MMEIQNGAYLCLCNIVGRACGTLLFTLRKGFALG